MMREREAQSGVGRERRRARREAGFTVTQMVITCAIVAILATFAFMGISSARTSMRVQRSAREFAGYVEKARADAIRRHGETTVSILTDDATSYQITMDFDLNGTTETRTISLADGVSINHNAVTLTFDWRGRLTSGGISLSFEGPGGDYTMQLDVTGAGDVTIGEEMFLDSEVPSVTLNNPGAGGDVLNDITPTTTTTTPPTTTPPTTTPPTTTPPTTTPPTTTPPTTTPPPTTPPTTTPPTTTPPTQTPPTQTPPPTTPPATTPPPTTPPSTTPPATTPVCSLSVSTQPSSISACNNGGNHCGSTTVGIKVTNPTAGMSVTTVTPLPNHLSVSAPSILNNVYTFTITATKTTRTTATVKFTGCNNTVSASVTTN
jgi:Tfp pilus assembly protein FimT